LVAGRIPGPQKTVPLIRGSFPELVEEEEGRRGKQLTQIIMEKRPWNTISSGSGRIGGGSSGSCGVVIVLVVMEYVDTVIDVLQMLYAADVAADMDGVTNGMCVCVRGWLKGWSLCR